MSDLEILILDCNPLTPITITSIKKNMPRAKFKVVKCGKSKIGAAVANTTKPTIVVTGGLVLNLRQGDIPSYETLLKYDICVSRLGVYTDHPKLSSVYEITANPITKGHVDLSIFIINPERWYELPNTDAGALRDKKTLYMPRYINHKTDTLVRDCIGSYEAFHYGMMGEDASVFNYIPNLLTGEATPVETFAYCFDKLENYVDELQEPQKTKVLNLAQKSKIRVSKMRKRLSDLKKLEK